LDGSTIPVLSLKDLHLTYNQGERSIEILKGASGELYPGETVALLGPSGSGKSSLLHILGLLDRPDGGQIILEGKDCATLGDPERTRIRRLKLGFIYQFHHLLPEFSALENIILPQLIAGRSRDEAAREAEHLLDSLGLAHRLHHRPAQLSGGEQQRVAIARGVINGPKVLLADEPTGNLDPETASKVFEQLLKLVRDNGLTAVIATHNLDLARGMSRIWRLSQGQLVEADPVDI